MVDFDELTDNDLREVLRQNEALRAKLEIAVKAFEYIGNSCPGPEQTFELENKRAAQEALLKITERSTDGK